MFQTMLIHANKISSHNTYKSSIIQMTDTHDSEKSFNEWYKTHTTTKYPESIHDDFYRNNKVVTPDDWRNVCFAIRFAEIAASDKVDAMTSLRIEEEIKLVEAIDSAYATEAMLAMANAIDEAWQLKAIDLVNVAQERVDAAEVKEADAKRIYEMAAMKTMEIDMMEESRLEYEMVAENTRAIVMMEELRVAESLSWAWSMTARDNQDKWWGFENCYY